jgi:glycosyltransferase involved in cell wall biosynthesis
MPTVLMLLSKPVVGDTRVNRESGSLAGAGYSITILAWNRDGRSPAKSSDTAPVEVELIGPPCPKRDPVRFALRLPFFWLACLSRARRSQFMVVHSHDFDTLPVGFLISKLRGSPLVYDAHESYAEMIAPDAPGFISKLVHFAERRLQRHAKAILVANENVSRLIGAENAVVLLNCPSEAEIPIECLERKDEPAGRERLLGYFGSLEPGRFILESVSAVASQGRWRMVVGGDGTLAKQVEKASKGSPSIEYLGQVPHEGVMRRSAKCDALHVMLDPSNVNYRISTPLRLFEAMSLGIPSIVTRGTYPAEVVEKEGCGYVCDYGEGAFSDLLVGIAGDPSGMREKGRRGKAAFDRKYRWEKQAVGLLLVYSELVGTADT